MAMPAAQVEAVACGDGRAGCNQQPTQGNHLIGNCFNGTPLWRKHLGIIVFTTAHATPQFNVTSDSCVVGTSADAVEAAAWASEASATAEVAVDGEEAVGDDTASLPTTVTVGVGVGDPGVVTAAGDRGSANTATGGGGGDAATGDAWATAAATTGVATTANGVASVNTRLPPPTTLPALVASPVPAPAPALVPADAPAPAR